MFVAFFRFLNVGSSIFSSYFRGFKSTQKDNLYHHNSLTLPQYNSRLSMMLNNSCWAYYSNHHYIPFWALSRLCSGLIGDGAVKRISPSSLLQDPTAEASLPAVIKAHMCSTVTFWSSALDVFGAGSSEGRRRTRLRSFLNKDVKSMIKWQKWLSSWN